MEQDEQMDIVHVETSAQKALRIPTIVSLIAGFCSTPLKSLRLVNSVWLKCVTCEMIERDDCKISMTKSNPNSDFHSESNLTLPQDKSLSCLYKILKNSSKFPCTNFTLSDFSDGTSFASIPFQSFYMDRGSNILSLKLTFCDFTPNSNEIIYKILSKLTPNVRNLCIVGNANNPLPRPPYKLNLPHLKTFDLIYTPKELAIEILKSAPNLESITMEPRHLSIIEQTMKIDCIKNIQRFCSRSRHEILDHIKLTDHHSILLQQLNVSMDSGKHRWREEEEIILSDYCVKLLRNHQETLTILIFYRSSGWRSELNFLNGFPRFEKLKTLQMKNNSFRLIPYGLDMSLHFPKLSQLIYTYTLGSYPQSTPRNYLGHLESLTFIEIHDKFDSRIIQNLSNLAFQLKKLKIVSVSQNMDKMKEMLVNVFQHFQQIKCLELIGLHPIGPWDSVLTGFSKETCDELSVLQEIVQRDEPLINPQAFVRTWWIGNIEDLTELKMHFCALLEDRGDRKNPIGIWKPLTGISGHYAFQLLPELLVDIHYTTTQKDSRAWNISMDSIAPFVRLTEYS